MSVETDQYEKDICAFDESYVDSASAPNKFYIVWFNVYWYIVLHCMALYGLYLLFHTGWATLLFFLFMYAITGLGITAGAHRLWSHRSYQAKTPLQILLMIFNTAAGQNSAIEWCRDHRVHHKYSETHADPHNAKRGFFFAHMGWLLVRKHNEVKSKGKNISIKDLENNPVLRFQKKFYLPLVLLIGLILPMTIPMLFWGESLSKAFFVPVILRYVLVLHATWLVNSLAHLFGNKPYDYRINPAESFPVSIFAIGEGFHNYHHTFPHDYSTSEFGVTLNFTTLFINAMACIGWAYDLKKVSLKAVNSRKQRTGDGTPNMFFPFKLDKSKKPILNNMEKIAETVEEDYHSQQSVRQRKTLASLDLSNNNDNVITAFEQQNDERCAEISPLPKDPLLPIDIMDSKEKLEKSDADGLEIVTKSSADQDPITHSLLDKLLSFGVSFDLDACLRAGTPTSLFESLCESLDLNSKDETSFLGHRRSHSETFLNTLFDTATNTKQSFLLSRQKSWTDNLETLKEALTPISFLNSNL